MGGRTAVGLHAFIQLGIHIMQVVCNYIVLSNVI